MRRKKRVRRSRRRWRWRRRELCVRFAFLEGEKVY